MESSTFSGNVEAVYADTLVNDLAKLLFLAAGELISRSNSWTDPSGQQSRGPAGCAVEDQAARSRVSIADSVLPFTSLETNLDRRGMQTDYPVLPSHASLVHVAECPRPFSPGFTRGQVVGAEKHHILEQERTPDVHRKVSTGCWRPTSESGLPPVLLQTAAREPPSDRRQKSAL